MPTPATIARTYVQIMLRRTRGERRRTDRRLRLHFSVQTKSWRSPPPGIRYDWRHGCLFGVTFAHQDATAAEAWITEAISAGYRPITHFTGALRDMSRMTSASCWENAADQDIPDAALAGHSLAQEVRSPARLAAV